jgi:hypothetical protein
MFHQNKAFSLYRSTIKIEHFLQVGGSEGSGDGQFLHPDRISIDSFDNVYVTDQKNCNVQKFTNMSEFIKGWKLEPTDDKCGTVESLDIDSSEPVTYLSLSLYMSTCL